MLIEKRLANITIEKDNRGIMIVIKNHQCLGYVLCNSESLTSGDMYYFRERNADQEKMIKINNGSFTVVRHQDRSASIRFIGNALILIK